MGAMSKKFLLSVSLVGTLFVYAIALKHHNSEGSGRVIVANPSPISAAPTPSQTTSPTTATTASTPAPVSNSKYKDGTYVGDSVDAYYGNVQVKVVISGGKITDVVFLDYPQDRGTSRVINMQAMPILTQEVIQAQSADISGVSGASATSPAFIQSVTSALNQATA